MRILQVKNNLLLFYVYMLSKYYPKRFVCVIGVCVIHFPPSETKKAGIQRNEGEAP